VKLDSPQIARQVTIPQDQQLRQMLDPGTYVCGQLERRTRTAVKRLALAVSEQLVYAPFDRCGLSRR